MPTYYIDFEGGNDANTGLSFAQRWKTITNGATAARIAPGDTIRIMASPDPTSIGSALWTGGGRPTTVAVSGASNATPIVITTASAHGLVTGDYVVVTGQTGNLNANGVWRVGTTPTSTTFQILQIDGTNTTGSGAGNAVGLVTKANNLVVKTASALVQNIALCGGRGQKPAWTASANVTTAQTVATLNKEGAHAVQISPAAAFTTGKAAYYTLPSTLDLSAYQQVAFWVRQSAGTIGAAGQTYVALCTDTIGDTVVHTCNIPALGAIDAWVPVVFDNAAALNSAIRSVAFYVATDLGAQSFFLDNIVACKASSSADSVTLQSLISKSAGTGDEGWYAIQSINSDVIMLANSNDYGSQSTSVRGYNGTTETVTTYKRETTKTTPAASGLTNVASVTDSGTSGNLITYSGGWNRTDMSTQTGVTWYDGSSGNGIGLIASARSFISIDRLNFCRYTTGLQLTGNTSSITIPSAYATGCGTGFDFGVSVLGLVATNMWANNNDAAATIGGRGNSITTVKTAENCGNIVVNAITFNNAQNCVVGSIVAGNGLTPPVAATSSLNFTVGNVVSTNSTGQAGILVNTGTLTVNGGSTSGNGSGVRVLSNGLLYLNNFTVNEATELTANSSGYVYSNRHDNTDNNSLVFVAGMGVVQQQTSVVESPATTAWRMSPTGSGSTATTALNPVLLKLGTVVCAASSEVTVRARMRRDDTGLTMRLICPGGQISGVANDVFSDMTAAANTWQTVSITFTPTKAGAVDIYAYAFGGTTFNGYVTNLTATQV